MKNYLSMGFGVNSVALYLFMEEMGMEFEAVFVDHGGDWPETYEYVDYFLDAGRPVTILKPDVNTVEGVRFDNIVDYFEFRKLLPSRRQRYCTDRFKKKILRDYHKPPCFVHIGIDAGESHRAFIATDKGIEYRYLLVENSIDRNACIRLIEDAGLNVPPKSGCYICPFQPKSEYRKLRKEHPDLFCRVQKMEETQNARVTKEGKQWQPYYLAGKPLKDVVSASEEKQKALPGMEDLEYPPCQCGL